MAIFILHKFLTVRKAQKIYVLHDGTIAESGSHKELMKIQGRYASAYEKQAGEK